MTKFPWVGLTVRTAEASEEWFGQLDRSTEDLFAAPENVFIRLDHVVWLEAKTDTDAVHIISNEDNPDIPFEHFIYVRKSDITMVRPVKYPLNPSSVVE